ncbi:unnamed protein product [Phytomonas sp. EM1]|nr:unnamed protein product [Phytomonas sp. EM1]|eukprot:CCW65459.1 unnamed protein product [Phytomonas sp. isolate EM1]
MVCGLVGSVAGLLGGASAAFIWRMHQQEGLSSPVYCAKKNEWTFSHDRFKPFKLISSRYESNDTRRFYFALDSSEDTFNMPVVSCIIARITGADGREVLRPYIPISSNTTKGHFEILVQRTPNDEMAEHLFAMQSGDMLLVKGPFEKLAYKPNMWKHVGMIASGIGIAPMYQMLRAILENRKDSTLISLIYANNQRRDILLANELVELQKAYDNFNMYLTLVEPPRRWLGGIGPINLPMVSTFMPKPGEKNTKILVSGSSHMMQTVSGDKLFSSGKPPRQGPLTGLLRELGYKADQVFKF